MYRPILSSTLFALLTIGFGVANASEATQAPAAKPKTSSYGKLPLRFELNRGQTASEVDYVARGDGYVLYLTSGDAVLGLRQNAPSQPNQVPGSKAAGLADSSPDQQAVLRMKLVGAETKPIPAGLEVLPGRTNYFRGKDPSKWLSDIPSFSKVRYSDVYPGIDVVYYGNQRQLEYDFVVAPGVDTRAIALAFEGGDKLELDEKGGLVITLKGEHIRFEKPYVYQQSGNERLEVAGAYQLGKDGRVGFAIGAYDRSQALVIDPVLSYSTFLGGTNIDIGDDIAVSSDGYAYVTGRTSSADFPTTVDAAQTVLMGPIPETGYVNFFESGDVFVSKLNQDGSDLEWSTFLGGSQEDLPSGIALDPSGNAYVIGTTISSIDFPVTGGALTTTSFQACFVSKLSAVDGSLIFSTKLGGQDPVGEGAELCTGIAVDAAGNSYLTGDTYSSTFPTTLSAFQSTPDGSDDIFFSVLNANGTALLYSTLLTGNTGKEQYSAGVAVNAAGTAAYVVGSVFQPDTAGFPTTSGVLRLTATSGYEDVFVAQFDPTKSGVSSLVYSTLLGADAAPNGLYDGIERAIGIAIDSTGRAYVAGYTGSVNFPVTAGAYPSPAPNNTTTAFVSVLNADATALDYSTFFAAVSINGIATDSAGDVYITGKAYDGMPVKNDVDLFPPYTGQTVTAYSDAFVAKLDPDLSDVASLVYSTYLGGSKYALGKGIAVDANNNAYITGGTSETDFPVTPGAYQATHASPVLLCYPVEPADPPYPCEGYDAFVAKIGANPPPEPTTTVVSIQTASPQYSDEVTLRATVTPIEAGASELTGLVYFYVGASAVDCSVALPGDAVGSVAILAADDGVAEFDYAIEEAAGNHVVTGCFFSGTANFADSADDESLVVTKENATVTPGAGNLNAYPVISPTVLGGFTLTFTVRESGLPEPDANAGALAGEIGGAGLTVNLNGVGGGNKSAVCVDAAYTPGPPLSYADQRVFTCTFTDVPVDAYEVVASVTGNYYIGSAYDVITVYNPAAGFVTGGGKFLYSEGSPDRVNFGLVYNFIGKGKTVPKGNLLVIRRLANGDTCRLKSNGMGAAAVNGTTASFSGKGNYGCTRPDGSTYDGAGNQSILGWVQDNGQGSKATGPDRFWVNVSATNSRLAMPSPASTNARPLTGGNIQVPQGK